MENSEETLGPKGRDQSFLVAEGDSWFALPTRRDVVERLKGPDYRVRRLADPSHTLKFMVRSSEQRNEWKSLFQKLERQKRPPKAILLSGGGNDLVGRLNFLLNDAGANTPILRQDEVDEFMEDVCDYYIEWVNFITAEYKRAFKVTETIPVLVHGYGYGVPDGRKFNFPFCGPMCGPWLRKTFKGKGHTHLPTNTKVMAKLVDRFNKMLEDLPGLPNLDHVHHIDLRLCLSNDLVDRRYRDDWNDELHPTPSGFEKVTEAFRQKLKSLNI